MRAISSGRVNGHLIRQAQRAHSKIGLRPLRDRLAGSVLAPIPLKQRHSQKVLVAVFVAVDASSQARQKREGLSLEMPTEELMLTSQLREHVAGWADCIIEVLLFAILSIEVADDPKLRTNVGTCDEFADPVRERANAVNHSFDLVITGEPRLITPEPPKVLDRNRRVVALAASHRGPIRFNTKRVRYRDR